MFYEERPYQATRLFLNSAFIPLAILLLIQQLIVASSTLWLSRLAMSATSGDSVVIWLVLYLASLSLPYIPGGFLLYSMERWSIACKLMLIEFSNKLLCGHPLLWQDQQQKQTALSVYSKEGPKIIEGFVHYSYSLVSCLLNTAFNIIVIAVAIDFSLLGAYLAGLVLAAIFIRMQSLTNERLSEKSQRAQVDLAGQQLLMWDNTVLGNEYNHNIWYQRLLSVFKTARDQALQSESFNQAVSVLIVYAAQLPVFLVLCASLISHVSDPKYTISLVVVLPRLFQVVNSSHEVLALTAIWHTQRGRLKVLDELFSVSRHIPLGIVRFDQLQINGSSFDAKCQTVDQVLTFLTTPSRFTVTGPNGSGKTTLLLSLKALFGKRAVYLPAHHSLSFCCDAKELSTGQTMMVVITELLEQTHVEVLLLDEWDANLDADNRVAIDSKLATLPNKGITVVEVRHHGNAL